MADKKNETKSADAKATKAETPKQPQQNGVTRPKDGTTTGRVWTIADEISAKNKEPATRKEVIEACQAEDINPSTAATQYGKWRKFHGLEGEKAPGRKAAPAPAPAPTEETDSKK